MTLKISFGGLKHRSCAHKALSMWIVWEIQITLANKSIMCIETRTQSLCYGWMFIAITMAEGISDIAKSSLRSSKNLQRLIDCLKVSRICGIFWFTELQYFFSFVLCRLYFESARSSVQFIIVWMRKVKKPLAQLSQFSSLWFEHFKTWIQVLFIAAPPNLI